VRDGVKGPLTVDAVKRQVVARTEKRQEGHGEILVVICCKDRDNQSVLKTESYLSNATAETELAEFARVAKAQHRIEECIQRAKSEAGLATSEILRLAVFHLGSRRFRKSPHAVAPKSLLIPPGATREVLGIKTCYAKPCVLAGRRHETRGLRRVQIFHFLTWVDVTCARKNHSASGQSTGTRANHIEALVKARCK
jgi:hypothetical protein